MRAAALVSCICLLGASACASHERPGDAREATPTQTVPRQVTTPKDLPPRIAVPFEAEFGLPQRTRSVAPLACEGDDCLNLARKAFLAGFENFDDRMQDAAFRLARDSCIEGEGEACLVAEQMSGHLTELSENKAARFWRAGYLQAACDRDVARGCELLAAWHRRPRGKSSKEELYARKAAELYANDCAAGKQDACIRAIGPVPWRLNGRGTTPEELARYWTLCDEGQMLACERAGVATLADRKALTESSRARALWALESACESRRRTVACTQLILEHRHEGVPDDHPRMRRLRALQCYAAPLQGGRSRCLPIDEGCEAGDQQWCEIKADRALKWLDVAP